MSIVIGGDFWAEPGTGLPKIQHEVLDAHIHSAQDFILNFEGALKAKSTLTETPKIGPPLIQDSKSLLWLKQIGVTGITLANNHSLDLGDDAVVAALAGFSEVGIDVFGYETGPLDQPIWAIHRREIDGHAVSIVSFAEEEFNGRSADGIGACLANPIDIWRAIKSEKDAGRVVIVLAHGGVEYEHLPPPHFIKLCRWVIDCGASAVITHHPHVPGFTDSYKGAPIVWSVGDFWLPTPKIKDWQYFGSVVELSIASGEVAVKEIPFKIDYKASLIRNLSPEEAESYVSLRAENLRQSGVAHYSTWWNNLVAKKSEGYVFMYSMAAIPIKVRKYFSYLFRKGYSSDLWLLKQLNGMRCASHRELWVESLKLAFAKRRGLRGEKKNES